MKKIILSLLLVIPTITFGAGGNIHLESADIDLGNQASLQRGFKNFMNYCFSCHGASYSRYNRVGRDLGITDQQMTDNVIFTSDAKGDQTKTGQLMKVAMTDAYAKEAFGTEIPDLSVISRARGADWIYSYLKAFYLDPTRPYGVNNTVFPDVGMPHVLWDLQGVMAKDEAHGDDHAAPTMSLAIPGSQTASEYDQTVRDITNFLVYLGEPAASSRKFIGPFVILFLIILLVPAYLMKKEYWKDVH